VRAVELEEELDAGVDRPVVEDRRSRLSGQAGLPVLHASHEHRARAAIAFFTDDLRAGGALVVAEEARERLERMRRADAMRDAVDVDEEEVAHRWALIVVRSTSGPDAA
jgi:hypothetical protein